MSNLTDEGYQVIRGVFADDEIKQLCKEADEVAETEGSVCVRRLRDKSEVFSQLANSVQLRGFIPKDLIPVRSILFDKTASENWPVAWHQDLTIAVKDKLDIEGYSTWSTKDGIVHVQPPEKLLKQMVTIRMHLDDTPAFNGALKVIPQSHLKGKIPSCKIKDYTICNEVICECEAGDILLMSPLILHSSSRSQQPNRRRIIHFEYAPIDALDESLEWHETLNTTI